MRTHSLCSSAVAAVQRTAPQHVFAVVAGLSAEVVRRSVYQRLFAAVQKFHLNHIAAIQAGKSALYHVPAHCRAAHIAVPRGFLGDYGKDCAAAAGIFRMECVKIRRRLHNCRQRIRNDFIQLAHPFARHVRGAEDVVRGLFSTGLKPYYNRWRRNTANEGNLPPLVKYTHFAQCVPAV